MERYKYHNLNQSIGWYALGLWFVSSWSFLRQEAIPRSSWIALLICRLLFWLLFIYFILVYNRDIPVTTGEPKDAEHEQAKLKAQDNSEGQRCCWWWWRREGKEIIHFKLLSSCQLKVKWIIWFSYGIWHWKNMRRCALRKTMQIKVTLDKDFESLQLVKKKKKMTALSSNGWIN